MQPRTKSEKKPQKINHSFCIRSTYRSHAYQLRIAFSPTLFLYLGHKGLSIFNSSHGNNIKLIVLYGSWHGSSTTYEANISPGCRVRLSTRQPTLFHAGLELPTSTYLAVYRKLRTTQYRTLTKRSPAVQKTGRF